jgi:hypothetical protein
MVSHLDKAPMPLVWRAVSVKLWKSGAFNRPFMIGICQGQTELSCRILLTKG